MAGTHPGDFSLWVEKSSRINAFATAGHTVAVTEAAAAGLPSELLEAVLAHELGHHIGGHTRLSMLLYWYSLPASYLFQAATLFGLALSSSQHSASRYMRTIVPLVLLGVVAVVTFEAPVAGVVVILFLAANFGTLWVRRRQEFEADAIASGFGYGQRLSEVLSKTAQSHPNPSASWTQRIAETHPSNDDRIRRLQTNS